MWLVISYSISVFFYSSFFASKVLQLHQRKANYKEVKKFQKHWKSNKFHRSRYKRKNLVCISSQSSEWVIRNVLSSLYWLLIDLCSCYCYFCCCCCCWCCCCRFVVVAAAVYACVFRTVIHFGCTNVGSYLSKCKYFHHIKRMHKCDVATQLYYCFIIEEEEEETLFPNRFWTVVSAPHRAPPAACCLAPKNVQKKCKRELFVCHASPSPPPSSCSSFFTRVHAVFANAVQEAAVASQTTRRALTVREIFGLQPQTQRHEHHQRRFLLARACNQYGQSVKACSQQK